MELSTGLVAVTSTLQIATNDTEYIDAEDGSGNNRFTVSRASGSQVVNVDFASNPTAGTDQVGAIRTYENGAALSDVISFLRNGYVGIGTNAPDTNLNIVGSNQCNLRVESTVAGGGIDLKDSTTTADNQVGIGAFGDDLCFRSGGAAAGNMRLLANGDLGIGTNSPTSKLHLDGGVMTISGVSYPSLTFDSDASAVNFAVYSASFNDYLGISNGTSDIAVFKSTGNVGIGTTSPASLLSVGNAATANSPASTANISTNDTGAYQLRLTSSTFNADGNWIGLGMGYSNDYMKLAIIARASDGNGRGTLNFCNNGTAGSSNADLSHTIASITSDGLTFNGDTAAANALDDYEEGTWTPVFGGDTTAGTYTFGSSGGGYRKIGSQVTVWCSLIDISESSAGSGQMVISGLPFTVANTVVFSRLSCFIYVRQALATRNNLIGIVDPNSTKVYLQYDNNAASGGSPMTIAGDYLLGMDVGFVATYYV